MAFPPPPGEQAPKIYGLYWGKVLNNNDALYSGRINATIPGLLERSGWLRPVGWPGSGSAQEGVYWPPRIGATVLIGFIQGDVDEGVYWGGTPGDPDGVPDAPTAATNAEGGPGHARNVRVLASTPTFEIYIQDDDVARHFRIRSKTTGDTIEMNDVDHTITLQATTAINIISTGAVDIRGGIVQIQGRRYIGVGNAPV